MSYTKKKFVYHLWSASLLLGAAVGVFIHFTNWQAGLALLVAMFANNYERYLTTEKRKSMRSHSASGPPRPRPRCKPRPLTEGNTMHNPKPDPSTMRPPAPPSPQNPKYSLNETKEIRFITRLDTDKPGLFIVKLSTSIPKERKRELFLELHKKINVFAPGSELIILPSYAEMVESQSQREPEPSDAWMNERIGEKETIAFPVWEAMWNAPKDRWILTKNSHNEYSVVKWAENMNTWFCSCDCRFKPIKWIELPK